MTEEEKSQVINDLYIRLAETPTIQTDRLQLRPVRLEDAEDMYEYASSKDTTRFVFQTHESLAQTKHDITEFFLSNPLGKYAITQKWTDKLIGTIDFHRIDEELRIAEIGYVLNQDYWGKGYTTEAMKAMLKTAFEKIGFNKITAIHDVRNPASGQVMKKSGMLFLAEIPYARIDNKDKEYIITDRVYYLTKEAYFSKNKTDL